MRRGNGWWDAELGCVYDLIRLKTADCLAQLLDGDRADNEYGVRERPTTLTWVQLGDLRTNRLHVRAAKQTGEGISKGVHSRMRYQIAADRAKIVVAVEEPFDGNDLRL